MSLLTKEDIELLNETQLAHIGTVDAEGQPQVTPVWVDTDGEHILFNTAKGRTKHLHLVGNPHVAVSVVDKTNDYRTLWVKGTADLVDEGADAHVDSLAKKYLGQDTYPFRQPGEERVIVRITPTSRLRHS